MTKLSLGLEWFLNPDHVPFLIGQEMGWFKEEGIDLELVEPEEHLDAMAEIEAGKVIIQPEVAIVSIFGPDFRERPGIAGTMFSALAERGVNILAVSTSISTVSCVIESEPLERALIALRETFDLP